MDISLDVHHDSLVYNLDDSEALFSEFASASSGAPTAHPSLDPLHGFPVTLLPFPRQLHLAFPPLSGHLLTVKHEVASVSKG